MRVVVWVDDVITRGTLEHTHDFYSRLNSKYPLRSWNILLPESPLKHLGFDITEEVIDGQLHRYMSQTDDVQKFLVDHGIELTRTITCPMPDKHRMLMK